MLDGKFFESTWETEDRVKLQDMSALMHWRKRWLPMNLDSQKYNVVCKFLI